MILYRVMALCFVFSSLHIDFYPHFISESSVNFTCGLVLGTKFSCVCWDDLSRSKNVFSNLLSIQIILRTLSRNPGIGCACKYIYVLRTEFWPFRVWGLQYNVRDTAQDWKVCFSTLVLNIAVMVGKEDLFIQFVFLTIWPSKCSRHNFVM